MTLSRRTFLRTSGLGLLWRATVASGAGVVLSGLPASAAPRSRQDVDLLTATPETFQPHVGSRLRVTRSGRRITDLQLVEVRTRPPDGQTDCFSLLFKGTAGWPQDTYGIDHAALGTWQMFLVPLGGDTVEAVINHVRS